MIELNASQLVFTFPTVQRELREIVRVWLKGKYARLTSEARKRLGMSARETKDLFDRQVPEVHAAVSFQRTLRIPDDSKEYPLPPGLGRFPLRHVDDFKSAPKSWRKHGGVMLPMHATEATWLNFERDYASYPIAVQVAAGKICAVSGKPWSDKLVRRPQSYLVLPSQPWLDGFRVTPETIRQFVAVPLGSKLTVERQLTGKETWGGLQLQMRPLQPKIYWSKILQSRFEVVWQRLINPPKPDSNQTIRYNCQLDTTRGAILEESAMGMGAGGLMRQAVYADPYGPNKWAKESSRCFVHLCLAEDWERLTGMPPPQPPLTARDYAATGLPWWEFQSSAAKLTGKTALGSVKSVTALKKKHGGPPLADNQSLSDLPVYTVRRVREF